MNRKGISRLEIIAIVLLVAILAAIFLPSLVWKSKTRDRAYRAACTVNLKKLALALNLYAQENKDRFPPIDDTKNNFMFDANVMYPEYLNDHMVAMCPADPQVDPETTFRLTAGHSIDGIPKGKVHPDCFTDDSYIYLGWLVITDKEVEALFEVYDKLSPEEYDTNITVPKGRGNLEGDAIHRLSTDVDKFFIEDTSITFTSDENRLPIEDKSITFTADEVGVSIIPIVWDRPYIDTERFSHRPPGGNVLFLDGHVEYMLPRGKSPYIGDHGFDAYTPMTETMARLLDERRRESIPNCD